LIKKEIENPIIGKALLLDNKQISLIKLNNLIHDFNTTQTAENSFISNIANSKPLSKLKTNIIFLSMIIYTLKNN
jgi:hypothetical protein